MTGPHISDEPVMTRWLALELRRMNDGIVAARKPLAVLLTEPVPTAVTKDGREYRFDRSVLELIAEGVDDHTKRHLRLPVFFYFDPSVQDSCFLDDEVAVAALQQLGEISRMRTFVDGRLFAGKPIAYAIAAK